MRDQSSAISATGVAPPVRAPSPRSRGRRSPPRRSAVVGLLGLAFVAGDRLQARRDREAPPAKAHDADLPAGIPDRRPFRSRRADDRVLGLLGRKAQRDLHDARRQYRVAAARNLSRGNPGHLVGGRDGHLARLRQPQGRPALARSPACRSRAALRAKSWRASPRPTGHRMARISPSFTCRGRSRPPRVPDRKVLYESEGYLELRSRVAPGGPGRVHRFSPAGQHSGDPVRGRSGPQEEGPDRRVGAVSADPLEPDGRGGLLRRAGEGAKSRGARLSGRTRNAPWIRGLDDVSREGLFSTAACWSRASGGSSSPAFRARPRSATSPGSWARRAAALSSDGRQLLLDEVHTDPDDPDMETLTTFLRKADGSDAEEAGRRQAVRALARREVGARQASDRNAAGSSPDRGRPGQESLPGGPISSDFAARRSSPTGERILFAADDKAGPPRSLRPGPRGRRPQAVRRAGHAGDARLARRPNGSPPRRPKASPDLPRRRRGTAPADRGRSPGRLSPSVELRRQDDLRPRGRETAVDPLPHRSRHGPPRALEGARASGPDGFPGLRARAPARSASRPTGSSTRTPCSPTRAGSF